jgi:hypothetical protein
VNKWEAMVIIAIIVAAMVVLVAVAVSAPDSAW